jgi:hypothetical protein
MTDSIFVSRHFNGPPSSGNGGYVAGLLARELLRRQPGAAAVEVTLRAPLTLEKPLQVRDDARGGVELVDGEALLAQALAVSLDLDLPPAPSLEQARAAGAIGRMRSARGSGNAYLHCFGCGIERPPHEGLRIVPAEIGDDGIVASDWTPHEAFAGEDGRVEPEIVWTALDCPAGFAWGRRLGSGNAGLLTGRITLAITGEIRAGEPCVVAAWPLERDGRKLHAGTALFDERGRVLAFSRQLWFAPKD